jgi:sporulation protein YlmC with PRC-barrel domain
MKKLLAIVALPAVLSLTLTLDAFAQQAPGRPAEKPPTTEKPATAPADKPATSTGAFKHTPGLHESSELIGTRIKDAQGKDIGEIDQLLIDSKSGKVSHVVVGVGGLAGVGEKKVVVPWSDVKLAADHRGGKAQVTMDRAMLDKAPSYEKRVMAPDRERTPPAASPATLPSGEPKSDSEKK